MSYKLGLFFLYIRNYIEQLKVQVPYIGCEKKIISLEALILHFQGEDLDESLHNDGKISDIDKATL